MLDARISSRFLFLGLVCFVGAAIVIYAGGQFDDWMLKVAGGAAVTGALLVVALSFRSVLGIGASPASASRRSTRWKLKHFWATPAAHEPAPSPGGATAERIAAAERKLGMRLPPVYARLLRERDGGEPRYALWTPALEPAEHACHMFNIDSFHDTERMVGITGEMIEKKTLPPGVICICGFSDDSWQLCFDYRGGALASNRPAVVAFDEEGECCRLAGSFEAFVADLRRPIRAYLYAPQGALGRAVDGLLSSLSAALGGQWEAHPREADAYVMSHPTWTAPSGEPATFELRPNAPADSSGKRGPAAFPETWSYRVLHCTIHPRHRPELERSLSQTEHKWLLVHEPAERVLHAVPFPPDAVTGMGSPVS